MKTSNFRIVPLKTDVAVAARRAAAVNAAAHRFLVADSPASYPCRHCLRWARPGERMILFPFAAIPPGHPYSESGPIFVHADECEQYGATDQYPAAFKMGRALRAYDVHHDLIAAEVAHAEEPEAVIERFMQKPETAFIHVRSASHGCYTMEVARI